MVKGLRRPDPADLSKWPAIGIVAALIGGAYWRWFRPGVLTYADWPYHYADYLQQYFPFPSSWSVYYSGLGQFAYVSILSVPLNLVQGWLVHAGLSYAVIERLLWFIPLLVLVPLGTYLLLKYLFGKRMIAAVGAAFYAVNTFAIVENAQKGHVPSSVAYGLMPLIVWLIIRGWERGRWSDRILAGMAVVLQVQYDIRFTYLTFGVLASYILFRLLYVRTPSIERQLRSLALTLGTVGAVVALLSLYWILPAVFSPGTVPTAPEINLDPSWVRALSFMRLEHALTIFYPFWGVTGFSEVQSVPWYFFAWPMLAFGAGLAVWYLPKPKGSAVTGEWRVVWLLFLALVSAFLVMGAKAPLTGVYEWLFLNLPGFSAFRDPSKHFMALAFAYAGLIGVTVYAVTRWLVKTAPLAYRPWVRFVPVAVFCVLLVGTMHRVYFLDLKQAFVAIQDSPAGYQRLKAHSDREAGFYRIMWVPVAQRFGRYFPKHPSVDAGALGQNEFKTFVTDPKQSDSWLQNPNAEYLLSAMSVKYIVVPDDTEDEIFRHYRSRQSFIDQLDTLPYLKPLSGFGSLKVYENTHFADHIYPATTVDYFSDRAAGVNFPELDRLEGTADQMNRNPALMFWSDYALNRKPKYGWELPDMGQSEQREGTLTVPFRTPTAGSYQLWAHRNNAESTVDAVTMSTADGSQVFRQNDPGRVATFDDFSGEPTYLPEDDQTAELLQAGFVRLGETPLPPGPYQLQIADKTIELGHNPINNSFEQPVKPGFATSSDHTDGRRSLQLTGQEQLEQTSLETRNFDPTALYRITFDYKHIRGEAPWYSIDRIGVKDRSPTTLPGRAKGWQRFSALVQPNEAATALHLGLLSAGRPGVFTSNRFDNIQITEVNLDTVFLRTSETKTPPPQVTFERHSPTRYTAHIRHAQAPFYLVFAESYHQGWHLTLSGNQAAGPEQSHVMMNGYANAWYLDQTGDYEAEITFAPEGLASLGALLSGGAFLILLGLLGLTLWKRR